jgi:hypothetical protein
VGRWIKEDDIEQMQKMELGHTEAGVLQMKKEMVKKITLVCVSSSNNIVILHENCSNCFFL